MNKISRIIIATFFVVCILAPNVVYAATVVATIPSVTNATKYRSVSREWRGSGLTRARASAQGTNRHPRNNMRISIQGVNVQTGRLIAQQQAVAGRDRTATTNVQKGCILIANPTRFRVIIMSNGPANSNCTGNRLQFSGQGSLRRH